jgi:hypothetical protein
MKNFNLFILILFFCLSYSAARAEIYFWVDDAGVKHFSNAPPDLDDKEITKIEEVPYDEIADQKRAEAERQMDQERARRLKAEQARKRAVILKQQQDEQERLETEQKEEAAKEAEAMAKRKEESAAKKARQREAAAKLNK